MGRGCVWQVRAAMHTAELSGVPLLAGADTTLALRVLLPGHMGSAPLDTLERYAPAPAFQQGESDQCLRYFDSQHAYTEPEQTRRT